MKDDYPIEFAFFYPVALELQRIRAAQHALSGMFWPLFGEYRDGALHERAYQEELYIQEAWEERSFELTPGAEQEVDTLAALATPEQTAGLLSLRFIRFSNGTVLIARMSHLAGDAYSLFLFLSFLAREAAGRAAPDVSASRALPLPTHARTALRGIELAAGSAVPHQRRTLQVRFEVLARSVVHEAVRSASRAAGAPISVNDLLAARALKHVGELTPEGSAALELTIPIDVRSQIPAYGLGYFGNGLWLHRIELERERVSRSELGALASEIRRAMPRVDVQSYAAHLDDLAARLKSSSSHAYDPRQGCLVSNASQLPVSLLDFGAGPPTQTFPVMKERQSAIILADKNGYQLRFAY